MSDQTKELARRLCRFVEDEAVGEEWAVTLPDYKAEEWIAELRKLSGGQS